MTNATLAGCFSVNVRSTDFGTAESLLVRPAGPYASTLSVFDSRDPNGDWCLLVRDDAGVDGGFLITGWSLEITTTYLFGDGFEDP